MEVLNQLLTLFLAFIAGILVLFLIGAVHHYITNLKISKK